MEIISSELSMSLVEDNLSEKIGRNVSKCIRLYGVKSEHQIASGPDASQVIGKLKICLWNKIYVINILFLAGAPTAAQQLNVRIANALHYLQTQINRMIFNMGDSLPAKTVNIINDSVISLNPLTETILQPLVGKL